MSARLLTLANRGTLTVLWFGMAGFVLLHSVVLVGSTGEETISMVRLAWFVGLALAILTFTLFQAGDDSPEADA